MPPLLRRSRLSTSAWSTRVVPDDELEQEVERVVRGDGAAVSPRYLEITKVSSNVWWNSARDSFA